MKCLVLALIFFSAVATPAQKLRKDIRKDNVRSLKGITSRNLSVAGFYIGMTKAQARSVLSKSKALIGEDDPVNARRIYVYGRKPAGGKGASLLYLIWDKSPGLRQITIFEYARLFVVPGLRPLFGEEAIDVNSEAVTNFLGKHDLEEVSLDIPSIGVKHITYEYCRPGIKITRKTHKDAVATVLALVPPRPPKACRSK